MKRMLVTGIALSLLAGSALAQQAATPAAAEAAKPPASKAHVLTRTELDALLAHPEKLTVIDVRRPDELTAIGGFPVYLSIQAGDLEKNLSWIPKDRKIVTVSNHAARAGKAADLLASKGYKVAGAVGAQTYEQEGGTLTKIAPPAPKPTAP
jgi:rhodanese-related sulfurtransferase